MKHDSEYPKEYSAGWEAFYRKESPRVIPHKIPTDIVGYINYMKDRDFNNGWLAAKAGESLEVVRR